MCDPGMRLVRAHTHTDTHTRTPCECDLVRAHCNVGAANSVPGHAPCTGMTRTNRGETQHSRATDVTVP